MNTRIKISVLLAGVGIILAFLPYGGFKALRLKPSELIEKAAAEETYFSVDQVARFVNNEDSTVQLVDVRDPVEYRNCNIPGSVNIPLSDLLNPAWYALLNRKEIKTVFYGNGDLAANTAWTLATGIGFDNCFVMRGGLNEWFKTVMLTEFSGGQIPARENALFENRYRARKIFNEINSLPDSLKRQYFEARRLKEMQLDGGCE